MNASGNRHRWAVTLFAAVTADGVLARVEQVALAFCKARELGVAGSIRTKARSAGFARKIQRLHADPPVGCFRPCLDQGKALALRLEEAKVAITFKSAAIDRQQFKVEWLALPEGSDVTHRQAGIGQGHSHGLMQGFRRMATGPDLGDAALLVGTDADQLIPVGPTELPDESVHGADLQAGRAPACDGIGQVLPLTDQRFKWLTLAARTVEVDHGEADSVRRYSTQ